MYGRYPRICIAYTYEPCTDQSRTYEPRTYESCTRRKWRRWNIGWLYPGRRYFRQHTYTCSTYSGTGNPECSEDR